MEGNNPSEGKVCVPLVTLLDHYLLALVGLVGLTTSHQTLKERRDSNISRRDIRALFVLPSGTNHAQRCSIELSDALTHGSPLPPSIPSQGAFLYLSPPPAGLSPWLSPLEPCPIRRKTSGPMILTPHRSNTRCTLQRKPISLGLFLVQHPMVRRLMLSSTRAHFSVRSLVGVVIVLFFQSMRTLLNPVDHTRGIRWLLVVHTAAMFSFATIYAAVYLDLLSIFFIDKRGFSSEDGLPPGPLGYQHFTFSRAISVVPRTMFLLNNWLVDGLLVRPVLDPATRMSNVGHSPSSIVAMSSLPCTPGS